MHCDLWPFLTPRIMGFGYTLYEAEYISNRLLAGVLRSNSQNISFSGVFCTCILPEKYRSTLTGLMQSKTTSSKTCGLLMSDDLR
ncbi:MAG: hypothetical protein WCX22_08800 [Methanoregula sp.]